MKLNRNIMIGLPLLISIIFTLICVMLLTIVTLTGVAHADTGTPTPTLTATPTTAPLPNVPIVYNSQFFNNDNAVLIAVWLGIVLFMGFIVSDWFCNFLALIVSIVILLVCFNDYGVAFNADKIIICIIILVQFVVTILRRRE